MENNLKKQRKAEAFLLHQGINISMISGFCFMQRHTVDTEKHSPHNVYGPGLLTLRLHSGEERVIILHVRHHPTLIIQTLINAGIPFLNLQRLKRNPKADQPVQRYHRTSLYMIWYFALFLVCLGLGFYFTSQTGAPYRIALAIPFFASGLYALYILQARFCHLRLDEQSLTIFSVGRSTRYSYDRLLKVNFDFAREANATHIMEILDIDYHYRLFYIGRTPRKSLKNITERLRQAGIDATCSLNDEKKHYHDIYHAQ